MNEFSEPMTISPTARKLAERYGVSPEVMEEIISDTRSRTDIPRSSGSASAPVTHAAQTIHTVKEPVQIPVTEGYVPFPIVQPLVAQPLVTPEIGQPAAAQPVVAPVVVPPTIVTVPAERHDDNALSAVTVILIILLILALIGLFYLWQTQHASAPSRPVADTTQVAQPRDTVPMTLAVDTAKLPPPIAAVPPTRTPRRRARTRHSASNRGYTTSSALGAQEHLADLRANGNHKAYLETITKGGNTFYRLHDGSTPKRKKHRRRR